MSSNFWELESWWPSKPSKRDFIGQNPLDSKILYVIGKLLECRFLKWACMTHLDTSNTSYGQKKGQESNWQFDSQPLKVGNRPNFPMCRWCATYCWKDLNKGYNFSLNNISIKGLHKKLWAAKVVGVLIVRISRLPLGSPETKWHWGVWGNFLSLCFRFYNVIMLEAQMLLVKGRLQV